MLILGISKQAGLASSMSNLSISPKEVPDAETQTPVKSKSVPHHGVPTPLHPILKKPNTAPNEAHKTTRLLLEKPGGESITQNPANSPTSPGKPLTSRQVSKKGAHFAPARPMRAGRRRPVFNRRKSSQNSIPKASPSPRDRTFDKIDKIDKTDKLEPKREDSSEPMFDVDDDLSADPGPLRTTERKRSKDATWTGIEEVHPPPFDVLDPPETIVSATASIADKISVNSQNQPAITPAVLELADQQDPILPQGIETVSNDPTTRIPGTPHTETSDHSSYDDLFGRNATYKPITPLYAPGAENVPVPIRAATPVSNALDIINTNATLVQNRIRPHHIPDLPIKPPWRRADFLPVPSRQNRDPDAQPSNKPLVPKDFRRQWLQLLEEVEKIRAKEEAEECLLATTSLQAESSNVSLSVRAKGKQRMEEDPDAIQEIDDDWEEPEMDYSSIPFHE